MIARMGIDRGLVAWVEEALAPLGAVTLRPMMGAGVLYLDGIVFAVVDDDALWLKSDAVSDADWDAAGCERFSFTARDGRTETMNYRRAPADTYDDAEALQLWARLAVAAGERAAAKRRSRRPRLSPARRAACG